jgi:N-acetylglutamate synthase-like GNAT family acetyltransferase
MIDQNCQFIELEKIKYPLVNQFYKRVYKKGIADKSDAVFIFKNREGIICSVKLKQIGSDLLLTGVACDPKYQHQGYATRLAKALLARQKQTIYCFPYAHLENFYLHLGFTHLTLDEASENIQQRFLQYQKHRKLLLMSFKQG